MAGDNKPADSGDSGKPEAVKDRDGAAGQTRHRHSHRGNNRAGPSGAPLTQPVFKGGVPILDGHIYDCCENQAPLFISTTKEVSSYVGCEFRTDGDDVRKAVDALALPTINMPTMPTASATDVELFIW
jgi:hypothetical protein